jgi:hypothetical protein
LLKDCFLWEGRLATEEKDDNDESFRDDKAVLHIFTRVEKKDEKRILRAVNGTIPPVPQWLNWSKVDISWTSVDQPAIIDSPRMLPLVVDALV